MSFIITTSCNNGGYITPSGEIEVIKSGAQTFEFSFDVGYSASKILVDGIEQEIADSYTFTNVQDNHTIELIAEPKFFTITSSSSNGGTVYPLENISVQQGHSQTFNFFPDENYEVSKVLVDGVEVDNKSAYTFNNVNCNHTISVEYNYIPRIFEIIVMSSEGGTLNPEKTLKVIEGDNLTFDIIPNNKYELEYLSINEETVNVTDDKYTLENIMDNYSVFAKFKYVPSYYTISASCNEGGKITNIGEHSYIEYSSIEYVFSPNHKYRVKNVIIDDISYGSIDKYTFSDLTSNHSIDVEFEYVPDVFTITTSCDENGTLSQNGEIKVIEGTDFVLDIQPNNGYKVKEILINGEVADCYTSVTISNVWENHTVQVSFEPKLIYTITSSSDDNCKIYPLGEVNVYEEDNQKFEISANSGYFIKNIKVDGLDVEFDLLKTTYTFEDVLENHTISVEAEKIEQSYHICSISSNYGSVEPNGVTPYKFGDIATYKFTPMSGYKLNNIIVDGKVIKTSSDLYTFYNVRNNHTITANFVVDSKEIILDKVDGTNMSINYDLYDRVEPSKVYLSKPNKCLLGVLNGIDEQSCNVTLRANNTHTISFDVYKEINGEETSFYDQIDVLMELYVTSIGWFKITQTPEMSFDGNVEKLTVVAESYEIELQQYDKTGFVVNRASDDSLEMMATDNTYLDANGYKLFRDNVYFYRDVSDYEALLNDFLEYDEEEQTLETLKTLSMDNPTFLISSWRFDIDINSFMENLSTIKSSLMKDGFEIDYLDEFQNLYEIKDSSSGETALTTSVIKNTLLNHSELIPYLPLNVNNQNINIKNKIFNSTSVTSDGEFLATLDVMGAYCVQGSEINFKVNIDGNKGDVTYRYKFGNDSNCMTDFINQSSIDWTSYYDIPSGQNYVKIPVSVDVVDTYTDDDEIEKTQTLTLNIDVYVFVDKDNLSDFLSNNNIALTYSEYETYSLAELISLEMQRMIDLSLLDQILLECPSWKVGTVDNFVDDEFPRMLCNEVGAFEIDSQDIYSLLTQTMAQYFSCIFVFDTINMEVNAYRVNGIGKDTNIHLGYRNVQNSIQITPTEELYTVFNVSNSDGLNLAYVNFGDREIEDISHFLNEEYLDSELINKYNAWFNYRESFRDEYIDYSRLYNKQNEVVTELYNRVPVDGLDVKQYESFSYNELDEELNNYIALIEGIKSYFKIYTDGKEYENITIVSSKEPYISYQYVGLKENLEEIQKSIYWNDYRQYKEIVNNILIAMYNFDKDEDDDNFCEYLDDWEWDMVTYGYMYGLDELKSKLEVFKNGIETYKDYSTPYEDSNKNVLETTYNSKREEYLKYKDSYDKCLIMLKERELEISIAESILNEYYEKRNEIAQNVKKVNWSNDEYPLGFSDEDFEKLGRLYKTTDYVNENIIYTSVSSTDDIVDKAYELYEDAVENLYANSHPRLTYSTSQDNLFSIIDYSEDINDLSLFNFIRVSIRDDYQVKLRVIEYSLNPMIYDNNLNLVFSNMIQYKSKRNDFAALLDNAISTAKNQISSLTKTTSKVNEFSFDYDLVKSLLTSKSFGNYMGSYTANSVTPEALESALSNLSSISPNSAFIQYLNSNLLVTNDAYMDYLNSNLVVSNVADIRNLMFGSATGTTLQSKFSSSVISLLEDASIKSAMIESLNASKINTGTLNTNYVEISSDSGNMKIMDNTIQIKDNNDVTRVQIGKDASDDYNMYVLDENGKVMFDATGLQEDGIKNGIIRDDMVSENANISGSKLNIQSLYSSMNDSGYTLNASNVKLDGAEQNLEVSFNTLNSKVTQQGNSLSSYGTKLSVLQGQIDSKIWKTDIDTLVTENETIYNLTNQFSEFEQEYNKFTTTVSETYATIEDLDNLDVGVRNLILNSNELQESSDSTYEFTFETSTPIKPNTNYTFTIHGFANNSDVANGGFGLYFGNNLVEDKILCRTDSETTVFVVTSPSVIIDEYHISIKNLPKDTVVSSKIEWICMYEGDVTASTSWIPAPEDSATISKQAMTVATQTAEDFNWLVTKDENTSEMTLTDEAIELISKSVEINGTVSFGTFDESTQAMLSSEIEANTTMILKLYNGNSKPIYNPSNLILNAYRGYSEDRVECSGKFKIEEFNNGNWNVVQNMTTTSSTSFELKLNEKINPSSTQLRCSVYTDEENPILIDSITLDIVDDFSSMLSVKNNKTYVDGGNVYCANLDADAILSNNINFTGIITGGNVNGGGIIKSYNYVKDNSGLMIDLYNGSINSKNFSISENGKIKATSGTISDFNITNNSIYSGQKSSINNTSQGIYMEKTGQFYFGDDVNYIRYYQSADGGYKLAISSDEMTFGNGLSIENAIDSAMSSGTNLIVLNDVKAFVPYGGNLKTSTKGIDINDYTIDSNTKYDLIGFRINGVGSASTYTISGKTNLSKIKILVSYFNDEIGALENYYTSTYEHVIDVVNNEFKYTFNSLNNTTFFNIGIGMDEGTDYASGVNSFSKFKSSNNTWVKNTSLDYNYYDGSTVMLNNKLYVLGGENSPYQISYYDFSTSKWSKQNTSIPFEFINGCAVVFNNEIHLLGGNKSTKKHYKYNTSTNTWTEVSTLPHNFYGGSAVVYNSEIHIIGGISSPTLHFKYSTSTSKWTSLYGLPHNFYDGSAVVLNNEIHILGSRDKSNGKTHCKYSTTNNYWGLASDLPFDFYNGCAVVINNEIHILGTMGSPNYYNRCHYKFDSTNIESYPWSYVSELSYDFCRGSAEVYNNEIYTLGGYLDVDYDYYMNELQLEKGSIVTDWSPSTKDVSSKLSNQLSSITEGGYSEITLPALKIFERNGYAEHDVNYYTFEDNDIVAIYQPTEIALYAGFHMSTTTETNEYMLFCYDTNITVGICEFDALGQPINQLVYQKLNVPMSGGVTEELVQYKFTVSDRAKSFNVLLGHPYESSFVIESVKLFKKTSTNINTNMTVLGDFNANCLNIIDDTTSDVAFSINASTDGSLTTDILAENSITVTTSSGDIDLKTNKLKHNGNVVLDAANYTTYCATASHTHPYLETSGGTLTGRLTVDGRISVPSVSVSFVSGMTGDNASLKISTQQSSSGYHPYMYVKSHDGHVVNIGGYYNHFGIYGYYNNRTDNGYDWSTLWDTSRGELQHSGTAWFKGATYYSDGQWFDTNSRAVINVKTTYGSYWEAFNLCTGTNDLSIGYGGYANNAGDTWIHGRSIYLLTNGGRIYFQTALTLNHQMNLGTSYASDGNHYYINNNGTGRFNALRYTSSQAISSKRYKDNIEYKDSEFWHDALMQIKPCTFYYKNDSETKHIGLIAEDLHELIPDLVGIDEDDNPSSVEYANLTIPLIGEVQRLNSIVEEQNKKIDVLQTETNELKQLINKLLEM